MKEFCRKISEHFVFTSFIPIALSLRAHNSERGNPYLHESVPGSPRLLSQPRDDKVDISS